MKLRRILTITTSVKRLVEYFNFNDVEITVLVIVIPYVDQNIREFLSGGDHMVSLEQLKDFVSHLLRGRHTIVHAMQW
jgi:TPP-dependent indolepyruvate ferredoxin oxidoreductase alpha subunit